MTPSTTDSPYKGFRFPQEIISHAVWLSYRFSLSYRDEENPTWGYGKLEGERGKRGYANGRDHPRSPQATAYPSSARTR